MFGWEYPPFNSGGLGVACAGLAQALSQRGVEVLFVLPRRLDLKPARVKFVFADIKVSTVVIDSPLQPYLTARQYGLSLSSDANYGRTLFNEVVRYAQKAAEIVKLNDFDVIHVHDWLAFPAGIKAKELSGKPLVVHVHATEFDRSGENPNKRVYEIEKLGLEKADRVVAVSNYTKRMIVGKYGINLDKVEVVWNGIEPERESEADLGLLSEARRLGCKLVLFVGRITLQKGPDYFLRAAKRVLEYDQGVVFVISGAGDMENQVIRQAAELGISDKVLFTGFLRGEELSAAYQAADLFVMPSVSEPFGLTALEAVASGTPVIVSKQSGVSEALTNVLKVDFWDTEEMANKILSVLGHPSLGRCLSRHAREDIAGLDWRSAAGKCVDLYTRLLQPTQARFRPAREGFAYN